MAEAGGPGVGPAGGVRVRYRRVDGVFAEAPVNRLDVRVVVEGSPVREFRSYRGRRHYPVASIPKLRQGSYFPHWLLERRRRAEQALKDP